MFLNSINASEIINFTHEQIKILFMGRGKKLFVALDIIGDDKNLLVIQQCTGTFYKIGLLEYISVSYNEHFIEESFDSAECEDCWMSIGGDYYPTDQIDKAIDSFIKRLKSVNPAKSANDGMGLEEIKIHYQNLSAAQTIA